MANPTLSKDPVYVAIFRRLALLNPPINIEDHIADNPNPSRPQYKPGGPAFPPTQTTLKVKTSTLDGIDFVAKDVNLLLKALRAVTDVGGNKVFAEGSSGDYHHLPLALSYGQTHGIGFREIWRLKLSERALSLDDARTDPYRPRWDSRYAAKFNDSEQTETSLHCAVARDICNIHIDEMGFVMTDASGMIVLNPNLAQHGANELLFKTFLKNKLPQIVLDRVSLSFPNSTNDFRLGFGVSVDAVQTRRYRVRATGSCSYDGRVDCSATLSFSGSFDLLGGR